MTGCWGGGGGGVRIKKGTLHAALHKIKSFLLPQSDQLQSVTKGTLH